MEVVSAENAKRIDSISINKIGIPSIVLMECAAHEIYCSILHKGEKFLICCGRGNNGGDGLALARKLILANKDVIVLICGSENSATEEFNINLNILINLKAKIVYLNSIDDINENIEKIFKSVDLIVDSIFGIGLNRNIKGLYYDVINLINNSENTVISIDVPSGLNSNNGSIFGTCVKANETYTVEVYKKGFFMGRSSEFLGDLKVIKIGFPKEVINECSENIRLLSNKDYKNMIPKRNVNSHKGDFGKVAILAGSKGYTGAAYITTEATVRTGSGLVTLITDKEVQNVLSSRLIEAMTMNYEEDDRIEKLISQIDVIACGPGLGTTELSHKKLEQVLKKSNAPIVLDADALNIISKDKSLLNLVRGRAILTPHPGEMSRLVNKSINEIENNRIEICREFAKDNNIVLVLKGHNTVISDGKEVIINRSGNSKMASGGMGDCLTGIIASLIGQKKKDDLLECAVLGCYIHGLVGDKLSESRYCVNARDIIENISNIIEYI